MIQVSASCPLMVDRAKMPLRLVMSIGPITRLCLQRERQWPGAVSWPGRVRKRQLPPRRLRLAAGERLGPSQGPRCAREGCDGCVAEAEERRGGAGPVSGRRRRCPYESYQDRHSRQMSTSELARFAQNVGRDLLGTRKLAHSRQLTAIESPPFIRVRCLERLATPIQSEARPRHHASHPTTSRTPEHRVPAQAHRMAQCRTGAIPKASAVRVRRCSEGRRTLPRSRCPALVHREARLRAGSFMGCSYAGYGIRGWSDWR